MDAIELPEPPPLPDVPVPMTWGYDDPDGDEDERLHRLAVLHNACSSCADPPGGRTRKQWLAELAAPQPVDPGMLPPRAWLTPEGEHASFVHGELRVHDRGAFVYWATGNFATVGAAFAYVVTVDGIPWTRALFWFEDDGRLHLEAASLNRHFHLENVFEHLWPPDERAGITGRGRMSPAGQRGSRWTSQSASSGSVTTTSPSLVCRSLPSASRLSRAWSAAPGDSSSRSAADP